MGGRWHGRQWGISVFLRDEHELNRAGGANKASALSATLAVRKRHPLDGLRDRFPDFELIPDLGSRIGSADWYRGVATCGGLLALTALLSPGFERPIYGSVTPPLAGASLDEARAQMITPLARGGDTGTHMGATALVKPLADTPERPIVELSGTLGGASFEKFLERSGVGDAEAAQAAGLIAKAVSTSDLQRGTRVAMTLGRRDSKDEARPLEKLSFRARFDLALELVRKNGALQLNQIPIAIDHTPLRIRGTVGSSLYRSARAAGAPAKAVEAFLRALRSRVSMGALGSDAEYDMVIDQARAETGEVQLGQLQYAAIDMGKKEVQLVRWDGSGKTEWFDPKGMGEQRGQLVRPVPGGVTSSFGMRFHPVLGYRRMHKGMDFHAAYGTPIRATADGIVAFAGRGGGYGNFVKLKHAGGLMSGYGHMSRIAVRNGAHVSAGQVIGYVGSTGLSTGPHLHWEVWKNGVAVNPASFSFTMQAQLSGADLQQFRAKVARLMAVPVTGMAKDKSDK